MELIKRNIHMDRVKRSTVMQFTMEEDLNLPEDKPDISTLNLEKGEVVIEEICPGTDEVTVRGKLGYAILYHTRESGSSLVLLGGALPFEERIRMEGVLPSDTVTVEGTVEDFTVTMINSRKLSLQALILLSARIEEIYDEELPVGIQGEDTEAGVEYRIAPMEVTQLAICKNDIFRKKEEIPLPSSYPNIYQILWSNISLRDVEFKPQEEKLAIQGDIQIFVLYEAEGEDRAIRSYETTLPLNGSLECQGCRENLLPDIRYTLLRQEPGQQTLTIQPDLDGEERILGMECALELNIRLYEEEQIDILRDIYGVKNEVIPDTRQTSVRQLLTRITGKTKITDHAGTNIDGPILQILHSEGTASIDHRDITEDGIRLQGSIDLTVLCITEKDETPYVSTRIQIPYEYLLSVPGIGDTDQAEVHCEMEQLQVNLIDKEEVDVKAVLSFSTTVMKSTEFMAIEEVTEQEIDSAVLAELPSAVIRVASAFASSSAFFFASASALACAAAFASAAALAAAAALACASASAFAREYAFAAFVTSSDVSTVPTEAFRLEESTATGCSSAAAFAAVTALTVMTAAISLAASFRKEIDICVTLLISGENVPDHRGPVTAKCRSVFGFVTVLSVFCFRTVTYYTSRFPVCQIL